MPKQLERVGAALALIALALATTARPPTAAAAFTVHPSLSEAPTAVPVARLAATTLHVATHWYDGAEPVRAVFWGVPVPLAAADAAALQAIDGIGPRTAATLLAAQAARGGFATWAEVDDVRGIGPVTLSRLQQAFTIPADRGVPHAFD